ncbi:MAG: NAD-dependent epimerase/dehydratase family protein [Deltaproteobacteria bacterium]|nr:NAD-dependent epimerase/dehydratase family protein [Deltaproteobacteria bacterium]
MDRPLSLVTGSCGFMGTMMCEVLAEAGHRIRATDLPKAHEKDDRVKGLFPSVVDRAGAEFIPEDLAHPRDLAGLVKDVDHIFHIAAVFNYSAPWDILYRVNVLGTEALLDAVLASSRRPKRFVLWGAGGVYGLPSWRPGRPFRESDAVLPANPYLKSKWLAEHAVMQAESRGLSWSILRPTTVYGPRAVYGGGQMVMAAAGMKVAAAPKNFTGRIPFVHVKDVCRAALHVATVPSGANRIFNTSDDTQMTTAGYFQYMASLTGAKFVELPAIPLDKMKPAIRTFAETMQKVTGMFGKPSPVEADTIDYLNEDFVYANDALKSTGFQFTYPDARDGLRDTLRWYRENGWLQAK